MARQFGRKYQLQIFNNLEQVVFSTEKLRINFEIKKGLASTPNQGKITVYNLSETTREQLRGDSEKVVLFAGYEELYNQIFTGNIKTITSTRKGPEIETVFVSGDGDKGQKFGSASLSAVAGTPLAEAISKIAASMPGVETGQLNGLDGKILGGRGVSFTGSSKILLDALGRAYDFTWSIQDGALETVASGAGAVGAAIGNSATAYVLSPETGLIGSPEPGDEGKVKVKSLLNPRIKPGRVIKIDRTLVGRGFYKVDNLTIKGDIEGQDWSIEIEGVPL